MSLSGRKPQPLVLESAGIRFNQPTDMVQLLNPKTEEWEDWQEGGVIKTPSTITVLTSNLNGQAVTASILGETHTSTFSGGSAVFTVETEGTVTITCLGVSVTVNVVGGESYQVNLDRPQATITITTENLNGHVVTATVGGQTYSGTFVNNKCVLTVYHFGAVTLSCNGVTGSTNVTSGGAVSAVLSKPYATLNLTTSNLDGEAVTAVVGGVTYSGVFSGSKCTIKVYEFGEVVITSSVTSVTQTVVAGGSYTVDITEVTKVYFIRQGETVNGCTVNTWSGLSGYKTVYGSRPAYCLWYGKQSSISGGNNFSIQLIGSEFIGKTLYVEKNSSERCDFVDMNGSSHELTEISDDLFALTLTEAMVTGTGTNSPCIVFTVWYSEYIYDIWVE